MPLAAPSLSTLMTSKLLANADAKAVAGAALDAFTLAIATAVVTVMTTTAKVPGTTFASPPISGPVTGASTITLVTGAGLAAIMQGMMGAAGAVPGAALSAMTLGIGNGIALHVSSSAIVAGLGLVAAPPAVTGLALISGLDSSACASSIRTQLLAQPASGVQDNAALSALATEVGAAVVEHLTGAGTVPGTGLISSAGGGPLSGFAGVL